MLYWLTLFSDGGDFYNLFRYITFRAGGAFFTALIFGFIFGRPLINLLKRKQRHGQPIRDDGPESHVLTKQGTPTMGGVLILGALILSTLMWARLDNGYVWIVLLVTIGFGAIGFVDDYAKVTSNSHGGISARSRLIVGFIIAAIAGYATTLLHPEGLVNQLALPVFKDVLITDYLGLHYVPGTGELLIFMAGIIGGGLGFLWYNAPPAAVFMGDTGSLALGGALGTIAVLTKHELVMGIIGGLFVDASS